MPNTSYTSDLIIATGNIRQSFARNYIAPMANIIMANDLWKNMIEQINVLSDGGIEIVPRIGDHVVFLGYMPQTRYASKRKEKHHGGADGTDSDHGKGVGEHEPGDPGKD